MIRIFGKEQLQVMRNGGIGVLDIVEETKINGGEDTKYIFKYGNALYAITCNNTYGFIRHPALVYCAEVVIKSTYEIKGGIDDRNI